MQGIAQLEVLGTQPILQILRSGRQLRKHDALLLGLRLWLSSTLHEDCRPRDLLTFRWQTVRFRASTSSRGPSRQRGPDLRTAEVVDHLQNPAAIGLDDSAARLGSADWAWWLTVMSPVAGEDHAKSGPNLTAHRVAAVPCEA